MRWWAVMALIMGLGPGLSSCGSDDVSTTHGGTPVPTSTASQPDADLTADPEVQLPDDPADVRFCLGVIEDPSVLHETPSGELVGDNDTSIFAVQYLFCSDPAGL